MAEIIDRARERYDFVLIDCPPVIGLSDTLAIAPFADAMIMVASAEVSKRGALIHAVDQLGQVGATVRAGVLNLVVLSKRKGTYGYGYGYGYGAEDDRRSATDTRASSPAPVSSTAPRASGNGATAPPAPSPRPAETHPAPPSEAITPPPAEQAGAARRDP
jgi:Mrp family chromosome partitioning ATPase